MKLFVKSIILRSIYLLGAVKFGKYLENALLEQAMNRVTTVTHNGIELKFATPNPLTRWRAKTFASKEPETLQWIDEMTKNDVLWDIGANVGLYSIYAAKKRGIKVFSFEPSIFNLELLGRNCAVNKVSDLITIIPFALSDSTKLSCMRHTTLSWGGALSTFGTEKGPDGLPFKSQIEYSIPGFSADDLNRQKWMISPTHLKIDVDGIEHHILAGAKQLLSNAKSILIEVNESYSEQKNLCAELLEQAGFSLYSKHMSPYTGSDNNISIFNQIWRRNHEN